MSGTKYTLTAAVGPLDEPVYLQALGPGTADSTRQAATRACRAFADVDGQISPEHKFVLLDDERGRWRREDVALLSTVAYVGGWSGRAAVERFLHLPEVSANRLVGVDLQTVLPN